MSPTTPTGPGVPGSPCDLEPALPDHHLARLLGGFAEPLRPDDLLSLDQPPKPLRPLRRWRYNAGIRLLVFLASVLVAALLIGGTAGLGWTVAFPGRPFPTASPLVNALAIPAFVLAYLALVWWWEKRRPPFELTLRRAGGLLYGLAWGVGLQLLCVGVLWVAGAYRVQGFDWSYNIVPALLSAGIGAAVNEEIMFRGILYRLVEDTFGTWVAIALSGLTFGLAHLTNAHASLQGALAIALEAGVLFAALYALTRSLWLVIGFHFAWNMVQGPVLGIVLSGSSSEGTGYLRSTLEGPAWLAGGGFGMEASLVTVVILTALAACLLVVLRRRGLVVHPFWVRHRTLTAREAAGSAALPPGPDDVVRPAL